MKNIIFYFSATGNSLTVARDIAKILGDTKIVSIADAMKETNIKLPYERVGIVFPSYYVSPPPIVEDFIAKLNFSKQQYVFIVITAGATTGTAYKWTDKYITKRGGHLDAGFKVQMPGNAIYLYNAWPALLQKFLLKRAKKKTKKITEVIKEKRSTHIPKGNLLFRIFGTKVEARKVMWKNYKKFAKDLHTNKQCTGCKMCARLCPRDNIKMVEGKPQFGENCEHCVACIQWCPVKAIEYKDRTLKRKQYRHPDIKASDLFKKNNI